MISPKLSHYLNNLHNEEIFRLASGVNASNNFSQLLMKIYDLGFFTHKELKRTTYFLKCTQDKIIKINVSTIDKIFFGYSLVCSIFLLIIGIGYFLYCVHFWNLIYGLIGLIVLIFMLIMILFISKDYKTSLILNKLQKTLKENEMLALEEKPVYFSIFKIFYKSE